CMIWHNYAYIF
nr:immunoglobulin light chain junction region [Macaca mulatta]MPN65569.1 immunoglobulin light chain junction region [Macaca mulatta]MPN65782.1 immunoglobulin light chain junction region [Macaca mulatta]MPN65835.1 immunoglobulin light chain junction region [Macaca mulatta]MPN65890.1 immunoglobulin light chain junction region [Macaca mulatta]